MNDNECIPIPVRNCPFCGEELVVYNFPCISIDDEYRYEIWHADTLHYLLSEERHGIEHKDSNAAVLKNCPMEMSCYKTLGDAVYAANMRDGCKDYLDEIYNWAFDRMEGSDEPEWSLFSGIVGLIEKYNRESYRKATGDFENRIKSLIEQGELIERKGE